MTGSRNLVEWGATWAVLPTLEELEAILGGRADAEHVWPPPGMGRLPAWLAATPAYAVRWMALTGDADPDGPDWCWTTLGELDPVLGVGLDVLDVAKHLGLVTVAPEVSAVLAGLDFIPLVWERGTHMDWLRVGIHGTLGTYDDLMHTFALTPHGPEPRAALPTDEAGVKAVADQVRIAWDAALRALNGQGTGNDTLLKNLGSFLAYDYVTAAVVRQSTPSPKDYVKGQKLMTTVVPSQKSAWVTPVAGQQGNNALPYEVACAVTLMTRETGASARGRVYMGGLGIEMVTGTSGLFRDVTVAAMATGVGTFCERVRADTPWQVSIVSRRQLRSLEVVKTLAGHVPDSQRRRRFGLAENRALGWTSPTI